MAKTSPIQPDFSSGELGPNVEGRVDAEKYKTGLEICQNYISLLQGPLIRRNGTKYVGNDVKDPSKPPLFVPFRISNLEQYILEFGDKYIRFYTDEGQIVTSGTSYVVTGAAHIANSYATDSIFNTYLATAPFIASRSSKTVKDLELPTQSAFNNTRFSSVVSGTILEIPSVWDYNMIQNLGYRQKGDTLWIMHSSIPTFTLQRFGTQDWDLKMFHTKDGPYLPLNSYAKEGDSINKGFLISWDNNKPVSSYGSNQTYNARLISHSSVLIDNVKSNGGNCQVNTVSPHGLSENDRVWIANVAGTTEINNGSTTMDSYGLEVTSSESSTWQVSIVSATSILLLNSVFTNAYSGSGVVYPAIFNAADAGRNIGLYINGQRYYGVMETGSNMTVSAYAYPHPIRCSISFDLDNDPIPQSSSAITIWQMGAFNRANGWPKNGAFHQNRLFFAGYPGGPNEFNASEINNFNSFSLSEASSLSVIDTNALQFNLISDNGDLLEWVETGKHGVYFASNSNEFLVAPSILGAALTPTNINNEVIGNYGSAGVRPVRQGDAIIYVQNSQRKVRELTFLDNLRVHRSTDITQLSDHIVYPQISNLAVQKEPYPVVWGYKSDGNLVSLSYSREESQIQVGWNRHVLGGKSDDAGSAPKVKSFSVMADSTGTYEEVWMAVQRFINGTNVVTVEYLSQPYKYRDDSQNKRDAYFVDCGATYDSSIVITGITVGSALISATNHGLQRNDLVLISDVIGMNSSLINADGVQVNSNIINDKIFVVGSTTTNSFFLQDFNSSIIDTSTYSPYVSGGKARKMVTSISGLTWLKNETVDVWADGGNHGPVTVNSAGVIALTYPVAVAQIGYSYKSRGKTLIKDNGSQIGSAIGMSRKVYGVAFKLREVSDFSYGGLNFEQLHTADFGLGGEVQANVAIELYTGIYRDSVESDTDFNGQVYFEQSSPGPGMVQSLTILMEENDDI